MRIFVCQNGKWPTSTAATATTPVGISARTGDWRWGREILVGGWVSAPPYQFPPFAPWIKRRYRVLWNRANVGLGRASMRLVARPTAADVAVLRVGGGAAVQLCAGGFG